MKRLLRSDGEPAGHLYSEWSESIEVPTDPPKPAAPRIRATIELQTSDNLTEWRPLAVITWEDSTPGREFIRLAEPK